METSRRSFLVQTASIVATGLCLPAVLYSCGSQPSSNAPTNATTQNTANCEANGTTITIGTNHGHTAPTISGADVTAGTQQTYLLGAGTSGHTHQLIVLAANFATLQSNQSVTIPSEVVNAHSHGVTIGCA